MLAAAGVVALLAVALGVSLQTPAAGEPVRVVRQARRDAGTGPAAARTEIVTWIGEERLRRDEGAERSLIVRLDGSGALALDHGARTWRELPPPDDGGAPTPRLPGGVPSLSVTPTGETRTIGGRASRKYLLSGSVQLGNAAPPLRREGEVWASEEAGASPGGRVLAALLGIPLAPDGAAAELGRIRGLPVLQRERTTLLERVEERETELVSVEERSAPPGLWDVPRGYARLGPGGAAP